MKLFGGSKNGKHTGGAGHPEPSRYDPDATAGFAAVEDPQSAPQPPAEQPPVRPDPVSQPPVQEEPPVPETPVQAPVEEPVPSMTVDKDKEDGFINSIVEAVGLAEQQGAEPSKPEKTKKEPKGKRSDPAPAVTPPVPPEAPKKSGKGKKAAIIAGSVVGVILLIVVAALFVMKMWITAPDFSDNDTLATPTPTPSADVTAEPDGEAPDEETGTGRKKGCYTFAIVGADVASGNTDTIMVGRLDTKEGTLNVISIPRDTLMNYGTSKINAAYAIGENKEKGKGVENLLKELKKLVGFEIDSYAVVNTKAVAELVEAIGGVEYDVPVDMIYDDPYQDLHINIRKGVQTLNGEDAVKVLRYRHGYADGDIGRINVQQDFLMSLARQMLSLGNIPNLSKVIQVYEDNVTTNLSSGNVLFYATEFLKLKAENIHFMTLPGNTNGSINGISYVFIDVDAWLEMINEYLNPFYAEVTSANVSIKTSTDGVSFTYTEGA
ncbi:MAG: LCP family protein [Oscillospiraceae bacterium]|nr:LCP family protein [Oscillospiraceae bacterium]MDY4105122.1 LCP family protein [Oscillospiraceae bacterium]